MGQDWPFPGGVCTRVLECSDVLVLFWAREAGCVREVAALYSDHLRKVPLY